MSNSRLDRVSGVRAGGPVRLFDWLRGERGQGVVEFAMVLPILGALVLIFIQFGKAINYWIDLTHVANEAARIATVNAPGVGNFKTTVCNQLETGELRNGSGEIDAAKILLRYPGSGNTRQAGDAVQVQVQTTYHWLPFWNAGTLNIQGSATMRLEHETADNTVLNPTASPQSCP